MKVLADAGLITCQREGQFVYSRINTKTVKEYTRSLAALTATRKK
jgi:DNA-binding transcriptional ArsR family regulator